jgi:hypothetical protein
MKPNKVFIIPKTGNFKTPDRLWSPLVSAGGSFPRIKRPKRCEGDPLISPKRGNID